MPSKFDPIRYAAVELLQAADQCFHEAHEIMLRCDENKPECRSLIKKVWHVQPKIVAALEAKRKEVRSLYLKLLNISEELRQAEKPPESKPKRRK